MTDPYRGAGPPAGPVGPGGFGAGGGPAGGPGGFGPRARWLGPGGPPGGPGVPGTQGVPSATSVRAGSGPVRGRSACLLRGPAPLRGGTASLRRGPATVRGGSARRSECRSRCFRAGSGSALGPGRRGHRRVEPDLGFPPGVRRRRCGRYRPGADHGGRLCSDPAPDRRAGRGRRIPSRRPPTRLPDRRAVRLGGRRWTCDLPDGAAAAGRWCHSAADLRRGPGAGCDRRAACRTLGIGSGAAGRGRSYWDRGSADRTGWGDRGSSAGASRRRRTGHGRAVCRSVANGCRPDARGWRDVARGWRAVAAGRRARVCRWRASQHLDAGTRLSRSCRRGVPRGRRRQLRHRVARRGR